MLAGAGSGKTTVLVRRIAHVITFGNAYHSHFCPELTPQELELIENLAARIKPEDEPMMRGILRQFADDPAEPDRVLAITFTNKAASEIKSRLEAQLGDKASDVWAGTFHSVCVRILRRHIDLLGYDRDFVIYDTEDQKKLIKDITKKLELDDEVFTPKKLLKIISDQKNELRTYKDLAARAGDDYEKKHAAKVFEEYQKTLRESNALDFDDIISLTVELFTSHPDVADIYKRKFRYVMVDEYQDTNRAQCKLMSIFASGHMNVMVVGDDDQSIYRFRGAVIDNILSFDKTYPDAEVVRLEQNYRSTATILEAANAVIGQNVKRKGKNLWCKGEKGDKIVVRRSPDQEAEAQYIADTVNSLVASGKAQYRDIAVLYRVNAVSNVLESVLAKNSVPHRLLGGTRFYDRAEIKDIIAYLCVINNPFDSVRFRRIVNVPKRGIGDASVSRILEIAESEGVSPVEVMDRASDYEELKKGASAMKKFASVILSLREKSGSVRLSELFRLTIDASGYIPMLEKSGHEGEDRIDNIKELISSAVTFETKNPDLGLSEFLEEVALISDIDAYDKEADCVVLMTVHSAKGLEFPYVFLAAAEENIFPSSMVKDDEEQLEEERRLCYVAITRAKKRFYITLAQKRTLYGRTNPAFPSRFIDEIPKKLCESNLTDYDSFASASDIYPGHGRGYSDYLPHYGSAVGAYGTMPLADRQDYFASRGKSFAPGMKASPYPQKKPLVTQVLSVGDRVSHPIMGTGVVASVKPIASDYCYEIDFETKGRKKIMASYAKLKKL